MKNELRRRAEEQLEPTRTDIAAMSAEEVQTLVHELQVHQFELEMQNQDLRETQAEQLELALDAAQMGTWSWDAANGMVHGDSRLRAMLGNPGLTALTTEQFFEYIHEEDRSRLCRNLEKVLKTGKDFHDEFRIVRSDGMVRWVKSFGRACHEPGRESARICGANSDITERRRTEQAFREAERFSTALNRINETIHKRLDTETIIRNVVNEGAETLGCESAALSMHEAGSWAVRHVVGLPDSLVGRRLSDDEERHAALVAQTAAPVAIEDSLRDSRVNAEHMRKYNIRAVLTVPLIMRDEVSGVLFFNYHSAPREFGNLEILFARQLASTAAVAMENARLVEERLETEETLEQSRDQLEERVQERTAQLRALAAQLTDAEDQERQRLAHLLHDDLQQQLAVLKMRLNGLVPPEQRDADTAKRIADFQKQINDTIEQTRTLSRELSPPALGLHGLHAALEWLAEEMRDKHGLDVRVEADSEAEPQSPARASFLFRAAQELLYNVAKHSGQSFALVEVKRIDGHIQLRVRDEGRGFDPEAMRQKRESLDSFGLLSIEERLAFLGGAMDVTGGPEQGCSVTLALPEEDDTLYTPAAEEWEAEPNDREKETNHQEAVVHQDNKTIRVLLADDHDVVRESLASLLAEEEDILVTAQASDGHEAVQLARSVRPDVVLMDVSMPKLSGIQATSAIRSELPDIRIVGLSMHNDKDTENRMLNAGADAFVPKDASPEELIDTLQNVTK